MLKKKGKIFAFFVDLKAAFDWVDREKLKKRLERIGTSVRLRRRIMETYKETRCRVKVDNRKSEEFWTKKGVRQGCPMSVVLFNVFLGDLEEKMRKEREKLL